jgi:hypothetical protein
MYNDRRTRMVGVHAVHHAGLLGVAMMDDRTHGRRGIRGHEYQPEDQCPHRPTHAVRSHLRYDSS